MKVVDLHVHSNWSSDSNIPIPKALKYCSANDITGIAFTDHLDIGFPSSRSPLLNIPSLLFELSHLQAAVKIRILKGIEVGITKSNITETQNILDIFFFDFIIASCHGNDTVSFCTKEARNIYPNTLLDVYLEQILWIVTHLKTFHTLAHFDYIMRYHPISVDDFVRRTSQIDLILHQLKKRDKALEINTKGITLPNNKRFLRFLLKRWKQVGGKWVTFGSDAHQINNIGNHYQIAKKILLEAGFSAFAIPWRNRWRYLNDES